VIRISVLTYSLQSIELYCRVLDSRRHGYTRIQLNAGGDQIREGMCVRLVHGRRSLYTLRIIARPRDLGHSY